MKGVSGRSWVHFPLYPVEKGRRQTTALQSHFPWSSPPFLVLKVEDGEWLSRHLCSSNLAWLELEVRTGHSGPRCWDEGWRSVKYAHLVLAQAIQLPWVVLWEKCWRKNEHIMPHRGGRCVPQAGTACLLFTGPAGKRCPPQGALITHSLSPSHISLAFQNPQGGYRLFHVANQHSLAVLGQQSFWVSRPMSTTALGHRLGQGNPSGT